MRCLVFVGPKSYSDVTAILSSDCSEEKKELSPFSFSLSREDFCRYRPGVTLLGVEGWPFSGGRRYKPHRFYSHSGGPQAKVLQDKSEPPGPVSHKARFLRWQVLPATLTIFVPEPETGPFTKERAPPGQKALGPQAAASVGAAHVI